MNDGLQGKIRQLHALIELSYLINSTLDAREVRRRAIEAAAILVRAETGSLILIDPEKDDLFFEVVLGERGERLKEIRLTRGQGIAGWVAETGEAVIVNDAQSDPRFFHEADRKSSFTTRNMICVPVKTKNRLVGVLQTINKRDGTFSEEDKELLTALANQMAVAFENSSLYGELREAFYGITQALAETIEKRDHYTGGHTHRVMNYSIAIGKMMNLTSKEMENLKLAAILHDIGKVGVRDDILLKKGDLDEEERKMMSRHTEYGAEILSHVKQLRDVIPGVRSHHEHYDGTGYPEGLRGGDIPCIARIIAVADTFDAMTTDRPYRKALDVRSAIEGITQYAGTKFDAEIVRKFVGYVTRSAELNGT